MNKNVVVIGGAKWKREDFERGTPRGLPGQSFDDIREHIEQGERAMEEMRAKRLADEDWSGYIFAHNKPDRLDIFIIIQDRLKDDEYWKLLSDIWTDMEGQTRYRRTWLRLLTSERAERQNLLTTKEQSVLTALPDPVMLYRGIGSTKFARGLSWTTDVTTAAWFAQRCSFLGSPQVLSSSVPKRLIFGCFLERGESEVVIDPRRIKWRAHLAGIDAITPFAKEAERRNAENNKKITR